MAKQRHVKVLKLEVLKPTEGMTWKELGQRLRDTRYRVFRLANLAMSEKYLDFYLFRTGRKEKEELKTRTIGELNRELGEMLKAEGVSEEDTAGFSRVGALPAPVYSALSQYKLRALTSGEKWKEIITGKAALPSFRVNMAIPIRCDIVNKHRRLERMPDGDVEVELMVCLQPYPRVVLKTGKINDGQRAVLDRLLDNAHLSEDGYRQRCFEIQYNETNRKWWLNVTYDFPAEENPGLSKDRVVGVDLGFACPAYAALNNGHARLGWNQFAGLGARVRSLQRQTMARRRGMLRGGKSSLSQSTARSGHGRKRKLGAIEQVQGRIDNAYTTLNHQISDSIVEFAMNHGAGVIQIENLAGLGEKLTGTFLGERWRYFQLQEHIGYKAKEKGIEVRKVKARYTSQRCSKCGVINTAFTREFRDKNRKGGFLAEFECPCGFKSDPDYNAARNLATLDIEGLIRRQCKLQGITLPDDGDES